MFKGRIHDNVEWVFPSEMLERVCVCVDVFNTCFSGWVKKGEDLNLVRFFFLLEWIASKPGSKNIKRVKRGC